jgi:hypothetical protein
MGRQPETQFFFTAMKFRLTARSKNGLQTNRTIVPAYETAVLRRGFREDASKATAFKIGFEIGGLGCARDEIPG